MALCRAVSDRRLEEAAPRLIGVWRRFEILRVLVFGREVVSILDLRDAQRVGDDSWSRTPGDRDQSSSSR